jgi:hypothetical protein
MATLSRTLYKLARLSADANAAKRGRAYPRRVRRAEGS